MSNHGYDHYFIADIGNGLLLLSKMNYKETCENVGKIK